MMIREEKKKGMRGMKRFYKGVAALAVAVMVLTGSAMSVSAAGLRDVFDAKYYADTYADLKAAFGYNEEALFAHYITCGLNEGRSASPEFDVVQYRRNYEDLNQAFGDNWDAYVDHYFNFGIAEGRSAGVTPGAAKTDIAQTGSVYDALIAQKAVFPEGMSWTNDNYVEWRGGIFSFGAGCAGFAFALSDAAFGDAPARFSLDYNNIRVGDILRVYNDTHSVIVLEVKESSVIVAEGNYNSSIHWGREIPKSKLQGDGNYILTRYPN